MLKRLLVAAAVAASTLVISSSITTQPADATDAPCLAAEQTTATGHTAAAKKCRWKEKYDMWCKFCYKYGKWRLSYCKDMDE